MKPATDTEQPEPVWLRVVVGALAIAGVAGGWFLPLWRATLHAPQYPGGLTMHAYGNDVTGDVGEISALNHYVGMRPFDLADFPELALWPWALAVGVLAVVVGVVVRQRFVRLMALTYLWGLPLGVLAVIQWRLHQYGQDLDPGAALRIDPFTPLVVGPTEVWNFLTWSWPGAGLWCLFAVAALVTWGPRLSRWVASRIMVVVASLALVLPAVVLPTGIADAAVPPRPVDAGVERVAVAGDLQQMLDRAQPGQRIILPPGDHQGPVVIDVPVILEGRSAATIVGDGVGSVVTIRAPGTVLREVAVRGSGPGPTGNPAGVHVAADRVTVSDVVVTGSYIGIAVEGADGIRLVDNTILGHEDTRVVDDAHAVEHERDDRDAATDGGRAPGRGDGIRLHDADHVLVRGNDIGHTRDGIYVSFGTDTLIDGNVVRDSRYAVHTMYTEHITVIDNHFHGNLSGVVLMYRGPALVLRNVIERHWSPSTGFGLLLKDVIGAEVIQNVLVDNRVGIHVDGPAHGEQGATFTMNTIARNAAGVVAYPSANGEFRGNSLVDNRVQVLAQGGALTGLEWSSRGLGNHWSTYRGYEGIAAGFGAVTHREGGAVDRLLARSPELIAIADSPALRMLRVVEERWGTRVPVVVDDIPLTAPVSPPVPASSVPPATGLSVMVGLSLVAPAVLLVARRRIDHLARRHRHVVPA